MKQLYEDIDDLQYDANVATGKETGDTKYKSDLRPCPDPNLCRFKCNRCETCGKKEKVWPFTSDLQELELLRLGGMDWGPRELGWSQRIGLAVLNKKRSAMQWPI